ncbi:hypothetical protein ASD45_00165 [Pseudolabrys sp. Root1462]|nr:hypothetical protein ASD45_00165 [Pseudolabrys sp. Root1462]
MRICVLSLGILSDDLSLLFNTTSQLANLVNGVPALKIQKVLTISSDPPRRTTSSCGLLALKKFNQKVGGALHQPRRRTNSFVGAMVHTCSKRDLIVRTHLLDSIQFLLMKAIDRTVGPAMQHGGPPGIRYILTLRNDRWCA